MIRIKKISSELLETLHSIYNEDVDGTEDNQGFELISSDTDTGEFDAEKGSMSDWKIIIKDLESGIKYQTKAGYHTYNGTRFDEEAYEFTQIKSIVKKVKVTEKLIWNEIDKLRSDNGIISFIHSSDFDNLAKNIFKLIKNKKL